MPKPKKTRSKQAPATAGQVDSAYPEDKVDAEPEDCVRPAVNLPIVGIGTSAGGLAALESFFSALPTDKDIGFAVVVVQHLAPHHKSMLGELIKRRTRLHVHEVSDGREVEPGCIYIIPPNRDMSLLNGRLHLMEPKSSGLHLPIDIFFRSLALDQREKAIGIILSGTGSDGVSGLKAIKGEGGMVMAQTPESAGYDGMPKSAIATGMIDFVLKPEDMPSHLLRYLEHPYGVMAHAPQPPPLAPSGQEIVEKIRILLRDRTRHDFSNYKRNNLTRRIERRTALHQIVRLEDYLQFLQRTPAELDALFRDLLIGVTAFFRDAEAFAALAKEAIAHILQHKPPGDEIRVWVPGCSTGEEAYSIAMLIREAQEELKRDDKVQIYATDIDSRAISQARTGIYPNSIAADVVPERLRRFFDPIPERTAYSIKKTIRGMLIFSEQSIIRDPPFSRMDLISCRNLLIYMNGALQKKVISLFHYALRPGGFLFLGSSESIGEFAAHFSAIDRKWKLFQRKASSLPQPASLNRGPARVLEDAAHLRTSQGEPRKKRMNLRELTEHAILRHYGAAGAVVNEQGDISYIHGRTGKYLEMAAGEAGTNILRMAREGLKFELATALKKSSSKGEVALHPGLRVKTEGGIAHVDLTVRPMEEGAGHDGNRLFLVLFEDAPEPAKVPDEAAPLAGKDPQTERLQQELCAKEEYLQAAIEEIETSNEELTSTNEELQSANEELQSTNEELETSREELQSVNEELSTVNTELQEKVEALAQANNDMNNLLAGSGIGTVFVSRDLRILRFTPAITEAISLIKTDVGRPLGDLASKLIGYDRLVQDAQTVLDTLVPIETEVQTWRGEYYLLRIRPYRTLENVIEGAAITFVDITEQKRVQEELAKSKAITRLAAVVRDSRDAVLMQDFEGRILAWNPSAERLYGWSEAEALELNIKDIRPPGRQDEALAMVKRLSRDEVVHPFQTQRVTKDGGLVDVWITYSCLVNEAGEPYAIATTERHIAAAPMAKEDAP